MVSPRRIGRRADRPGPDLSDPGHIGGAKRKRRDVPFGRSKDREGRDGKTVTVVTPLKKFGQGGKWGGVSNISGSLSEG
eukprot:753676-Hanusia_phi.AAC.22